MNKCLSSSNILRIILWHLSSCVAIWPLLASKIASIALQYRLFWPSMWAILWCKISGFARCWLSGNCLMSFRGNTTKWRAFIAIIIVYNIGGVNHHSYLVSSRFTCILMVGCFPLLHPHNKAPTLAEPGLFQSYNLYRFRLINMDY